MDIVKLIIFVLGVIGITNIIVEGKIFHSVREWFKDPPIFSWKKIISNIFSFKWLTFKLLTFANTCQVIYSIITCYQCMGMWAGSILGLVFGDYNIFFLILCGGTGSFLSNFFLVYMNYLDAQTIVYMDKK